MKQIYLMIAACLAANFCLAQPTITGNAVTPSAGETYTYHGYDASTFNPGASGANVTWDFSGVASSGATTYSYINTGSAPHGSSFPSSNVAIYDAAAPSESFYQLDASQYSVAGIVQGNNDIVDDYNGDIREIVKFPITYQNTFNETFSGTQFIAQVPFTWNRGGNITIEADGYGTLIMPYGTINNVLRIKTTTVYSDTDPAQVFPPNNYSEELYLWYHPSTKSFLFSYVAFELVDFGTTTYTGTYLDQVHVGVEELLASAIDLKMYPNPTNDQLSVSFDLQNRSEVQIQVTDMTGRIVMDVPVSSVSAGTQTKTVDLSTLQTGMYMVSILVDNRKVTKMINKL
jgi:hypothetical protein